MALNCRLDRNITLSQGGEGVDGCNGQDISIGVGGISSPVLVYNIDDVPSLTFEGDNRSDYSLYVDTINSTGQFYKVDHTDATYNEEYDTANHKWTHTLTLTVANITSLFEDILSDAVNGKYLVCFRPNGDENYRMFGWRYGATLDYSLNITSDSLGYTITFEDTSEYPLFTVERDNFGNNSKIYTPTFRPNWNSYICEQSTAGTHTGYAIAMYVPKVNAAGQPLDRNNKLCQWSGLKQDAYKFSGITSDGGYNIIGTYGSTATFDGRPVRVLDYEKCPANVTNSIFINSKKAETINLNSTISAGTFTITSTDDWMMVTDPQFVTISPVEGENGNTQCSVHHNDVGGCEQIKFMNKVTHEIVTLDVCVNLITVGNNYTFDCLTKEVIITPVVEGCSSAYTYSMSPNTAPNWKDSNGYIHIIPSGVTSATTYTLTLTHSCDSNEVKVVPVKIVCDGTDENWQLVSSYCEYSEAASAYTNYRINIYVDINPSSPTFNTTKTEKTYDATCSTDPATWQLVGSYCELDVQGANTGYYVTQYMDVNTNSPTYGDTKEEKALDEIQCPPPNKDPNWIKDPKFDGYCEQIYYEPGHVEGNSGYWIDQEIDDNRLSPTYQTTRPTKELSDDCPVPDTTPNVEEVSAYCVLVENEEGNLVMNGDIDITGLDTNVFSPTYLQVTTVREHDEERCPPTGKHDPTGCTAFIVDGGHWDNVPASGDSACDSAFLYIDGTPVFEPASASTWVTPRFCHWDEDTHDYQHFCSLYDQAPCVAESFMRHAGITPDVKPEMCGGEAGVPMPQEVYDAINGNSEYTHALGTIWYDVAANDGDSRSCTIKWLVDNVECMSAEFNITQLAGSGGGGCDCTNFKISSIHATVPYSTGTTEYHIGNYTGSTGCPNELYNGGLNNGSDFLGSFRFSGGKIYAKVKTANSSTTTRQAQYKIRQSDSCIGYVNVTQAAAPVPQENVFKWNVQDQETSYSATVSGNVTTISLPQFTSYYNGSQPNGVMSSSDSWIITNSPVYTNNNELVPNVNNTLYIAANSTNSTRVGTMTLTQKGTTNKIRLYIIQGPYVPNCTITSFNIASSVVKGNPITYSYQVADTRCSQTFHFYLYDANHNEIHVTSVPSQGIGAGEFPTTGASVGTASISVPVNGELRNYSVDITNNNVIVSTFVLHNNTNSTVYPNKIGLIKNGAPTVIVDIGQKTITAGSGLYVQKELSNSLQNYVFNGLTVRDDWNLNKTYRASADSNTITNNGTIHIYITGVIS